MPTSQPPELHQGPVSHGAPWEWLDPQCLKLRAGSPSPHHALEGTISQGNFDPVPHAHFKRWAQAGAQVGEVLSSQHGKSVLEFILQSRNQAFWSLILFLCLSPDPRRERWLGT